MVLFASRLIEDALFYRHPPVKIDIRLHVPKKRRLLHRFISVEQTAIISWYVALNTLIKY